MSRCTKEEAKTIIQDLDRVDSILDNAEYTAKAYVKDPSLTKKLGEMRLNVKETRNELNNKLNSKQG